MHNSLFQKCWKLRNWGSLLNQGMLITCHVGRHVYNNTIERRTKSFNIQDEKTDGSAVHFANIEPLRWLALINPYLQLRGLSAGLLNFTSCIHIDPERALWTQIIWLRLTNSAMTVKTIITLVESRVLNHPKTLLCLNIMSCYDFRVFYPSSIRASASATLEQSTGPAVTISMLYDDSTRMMIVKIITRISCIRILSSSSSSEQYHNISPVVHQRKC